MAFLLPAQGALDWANGMNDPEARRLLRRAAWRLAAWQGVLTLLVAMIAGWLGTRAGAWSALAGGCIGTVTGLYQALRLFSVDAAAGPERFMRAVYVGEFMKIVITAALFVVVIRVMKPRFLPMMAAYAATFLAYWMALGTGYPWFGDRRAARPVRQGTEPGEN
ncbi:MAG: ATP synthase subunit I [Gammaproteobacteria bacterium]|nr:ATP synthase subunit I [Gammaproteobacteria bacterium]